MKSQKKLEKISRITFPIITSSNPIDRFYFVKNISDVINIALDTGLSLEEVENIVKLTYSNVNKNSKL